MAVIWKSVNCKSVCCELCNNRISTNTSLCECAEWRAWMGEYARIGVLGRSTYMRRITNKIHRTMLCMSNGCEEWSDLCRRVTFALCTYWFEWFTFKRNNMYAIWFYAHARHTFSALYTIHVWCRVLARVRCVQSCFAFDAVRKGKTSTSAAARTHTHTRTVWHLWVCWSFMHVRFVFHSLRQPLM